MLFIFISAYIFPDSFHYRYVKGEKYRIVTEVLENVYLDGEFNNKAEILNKVTVEVRNVKNGSGLLFGTFQVSEKAWNSAGPYQSSDEVYTSEFWRDEQGRYTIGDSYLMPIIRNIPLFPEKELEPGDTWHAEGEETHDLETYGMSNPLRIPISVYYIYLGNELKDGVEVAVFDIQFATSINLRNQGMMGALFPVKIKGDTRQIYYWDINRGRPHSYQDQFDYIYLLSNGRYIEFEGSSTGRVIQEPELDREKVSEEIRREIEKRGIKNASVVPDEEGVTITLENIQFTPDSSYLMPSEREKLDQIAEILKNYPNRDLLIIGHTALAGTEEERQYLSEKRAEVVGKYLLSRNVREENQMVYKGVGAARPIADNFTDVGRMKNRRVEIKILEN
jgi:outer membrane protein OmpA-like peptidoglycan-associated protein